MSHIIIAGVECSGKTVLMATLADKYKVGDANGFFLSPHNQQTMAFSNTLAAILRQGIWPAATPVDTAEAYQWTLMQSVGNAPAKKIRDIEYLDYGGEVYRAAFGMPHKKVKQEIVDSLKDKIENAPWLVILINLSDLINGSPSDRKYNETGWIPKGILDYVTDGNCHRIRRDHIAIILTQADSYANTIKSLGGPRGALERYLPHLTAAYGNIKVFAVSAVNKVVPDANGNPVPAADFGSDGFDEMINWLSRRDFPEWDEVVRENELQVDLSQLSAEECWFCGKHTDSSLWLRMRKWWTSFYVPVPCCDECETKVARATIQYGASMGCGFLAVYFVIGAIVLACKGDGHTSIFLTIFAVLLVVFFIMYLLSKKVVHRLQAHPIVAGMESKGYKYKISDKP